MPGYESSVEKMNLKYDDVPHRTFLKDKHLTSSGWRVPMDNSAKNSEVCGGIDGRMEQLQIPKFNGDKTKFEYFWATNRGQFHRALKIQDDLIKVVPRGQSRRSYSQAKVFK